MNKPPTHRAVTLCAALLFLAIAAPYRNAFSQTADGKDGKPVPPLVATPSNPAHWKIIPSQRTPPASDDSKPADIKEWEFFINPSASGMITRWASGKSTEAWISEGCLLHSVPDSPDIYVTPLRLRPAGFDGGFQDFYKLYPGFTWLSLEHFASTVFFNSKKCYHYIKKGTRNEAWVEVGTNLPVAYSDEHRRYTYEFLAPAQKELNLPEKFRQELENTKKAESQ